MMSSHVFFQQVENCACGSARVYLPQRNDICNFVTYLSVLNKLSGACILWDLRGHQRVRCDVFVICGWTTTSRRWIRLVAPAVDKQVGSKYGNNNRCRCGTLLSHHHAEHPSAASHLGYASSHDGRSWVIITLASHAKGPQFVPGRKHHHPDWFHALLDCSSAFLLNGFTFVSVFFRFQFSKSFSSSVTFRSLLLSTT